ncbi:hypothetical protein B0H14DRAFT_2336800 [Mycena olivaceomarginata]|nr:hypothetical protein B0H14DRAFT_2336800 [Mycena olivaceomarginata]
MRVYEHKHCYSVCLRDYRKPKDDVAYHNTRLLTRDLLMVIVLVRAISDGDIVRVEALLPHLAIMFRGGLQQVLLGDPAFHPQPQHVWTPQFAYDNGSIS